MQLAEYVHDFNRSVGDGDWSRVADWFSEDAVLEFRGPPVGPFIGRAAIAAAYAASPPDDEIEIIGQPEKLADTTAVPYRWTGSGATGTMRVEERGNLIARLVVTFD